MKLYITSLVAKWFMVDIFALQFDRVCKIEGHILTGQWRDNAGNPTFVQRGVWRGEVHQAADVRLVAQICGRRLLPLVERGVWRTGNSSETRHTSRTHWEGVCVCVRLCVFL